MALFHEDGHLNDEAFEALAQGTPDEMQLLEVSEHLGFCAPCMERYLAALDEDALLPAPAGLQGDVMRKVRKANARPKLIRLRKYVTVAAAACLVVALWASGFFSALQNPTALSDRRMQQAETQMQTQPSPGPRDYLNSAVTALSDGVSGLFEALRPAEEDKTQTEKDPAGQNTPKPGALGTSSQAT